MRKLLVAICALGFSLAGAAAQQDIERPGEDVEDPAVESPADAEVPEAPEDPEEPAADTEDPLPDPTEERAVVPPTEETVTIAVIAVEGDRANEGCHEGIERGLADYGYRDGDTMELIFEVVEDTDRIPEFIASLPNEATTVVAPVGTEAASAAAPALDERPMVFCAVPDPVTAGLVDNMMRPGGSATGVSDMVPLSQHLALIREVLPTVVYLGVIYNDEDEGSVRLVDRLESFLPGAGFQLVEETVSSPDEVMEAAQSVAAEAHVLYILPDRTVVEALEDLIEVAEANDRPLFVADAQLVDQGAVGSRAFDYYEIGLQTANTMARVLDSENPADIPVDQAELTNLVINVGAAERMGVQFAPGFVARADEVVEDEFADETLVED